MKCETWVWGCCDAAKFDGHEISKADALRIARDEIGMDVTDMEVHRVYVVRNPEEDGKGDADVAFKKCDAETPGAVAVTLVCAP